MLNYEDEILVENQVDSLSSSLVLLLWSDSIGYIHLWMGEIGGTLQYWLSSTLKPYGIMPVTTS